MVDSAQFTRTHFQTGESLALGCGSWEKIMVDLRTSRGIFKQVKRSGLLTDFSHDLHACGNVLMHIDMFSGM